MKVFADKVNDVTLSNLGESTGFEVADGGKMVLTILRNAYSNPVGAVIRELCKNAEEVAGADFRVHVPTDFEPWFSVIDNGTGLDHPSTIKYFSGLGASTKDMDDTKAGGFGIGCKVPFSYCDDYQVIVRYQGKIRTYLAFLDDYQKPQFNMAHEADTTEPNGVEVRVPVRAGDIAKFRKEIPVQLMFFDPVPKMNVTDIEVGPPEYKYEGSNWRAYSPDNSIGSYGAGVASRVIMGGLSYPISRNHKDFYNATRMCFHITLPIGTVPLAMSREDLMYNDKTQDILDDVHTEYVDIIQKLSQERVDKAETLYEAYETARDAQQVLKNVMGRGSVTPDFDWKGYKGLVHSISTHLEPVSNLLIGAMHYSSYDVRRLQSISGKHHILTESRIHLQLLNNNTFVFYKGQQPSKIPSTIKYNFPNTASDIYVMEDNQQLRTYLKEYGLPAQIREWDDLKDPPKNTNRALVKDLYQFNNSRYGYGKDKWDPTQIDDLERSTGIYVDLNRWSIVGSRDFGDFRWLKQGKFIPEDTVMYGIPASRKNTLKDHPNFMSLEEACQVAEEQIAEEAEKSTPRVLKGHALDYVKRVYKLYKPLDNAEGSLYNKLSALEINIEDKHKNFIIYNNEDRVEYFKESLMRMVNRRYPLLRYISGKASDKLVAEYVNQMEKLK